MAYISNWQCDNCGKLSDRANFEFTSSWYTHNDLKGNKYYCSLECVVVASAS